MPSISAAILGGVGMPVLQAMNGEALAFTPDGQSERTIWGIWISEDGDIVPSSTGDDFQRRAKVIASTVAIQGATAVGTLTVERDFITKDGERWVLIATGVPINNSVELEFERRESLRHSGDGYVER